MAEKRKKISDLNDLYNQCETAHSALFSEQRSNVLLVAGNHYHKRGSGFWRQVRNNQAINRDQKVRLVKNHIQSITKSYINNILHYAPGVAIEPKNKSEFHDQKVAELHESVWADLKDRHNYDRLKTLLCKDYIEIGEAWLKVFFDPKKGDFLGYEARETDDSEEMEASPSFSGIVEWERHHGFNVLTDHSARSYEECRYVIFRKMIPTADLKKDFENDEDKLKFIDESSKQTYMLFDASNGGYSSTSSGLTLVREYYYRPCADYPNGYFWITTEEGILYEGELPYGIFPICYIGFDEASTSSRSFSIIKQLRPYQAEINRAASKIAEHQITLGDDKIVIQAGATLSAGATAHGVKAIKTSGPITHLPGRTGEQYVPYMESQISEMYQIAKIAEDSNEKIDGNLDPYAMLFREMKDKKQFSIYGDKFVGFLKEWCWLSLFYAKRYYDEDMLIQVLDKKEIVNIAEFKSSDDLSFEISVVEQSEDIESRLGKQLALNNALQFAGSQLSEGAIGQVLRNMPFLNKEEIATDLTIDYDNMKSDILAMDRGEFVPANQYDTHEYVIKKLIHRMKMKDFQFLHPAIQSNYQVKLQQHEKVLADQKEAAAHAQAGFIPSGGFLVKCDVRIPDPMDPSKTQILKLPMEAVSWLIDKLDAQGSTISALNMLPEQAQADIGNMTPPMLPPNQGGTGDLMAIA